MVVEMVNTRTGEYRRRSLSADNAKLLCDVMRLMDECPAFWEEFQTMTAGGCIPSPDDVQQLVKKWTEKQGRSGHEDPDCLSA